MASSWPDYKLRQGRKSHTSLSVGAPQALFLEVLYPAKKLRLFSILDENTCSLETARTPSYRRWLASVDRAAQLRVLVTTATPFPSSHGA
jgi:hypothetical protein